MKYRKSKSRKKREKKDWLAALIERRRPKQSAPAASGTPPAPGTVRIQHSPGGLRGRWLMNSLSFVVVILAAVVIAVTMGFSSYYYNSIHDMLSYRMSTLTTNFYNSGWLANLEYYYYGMEKTIGDFDINMRDKIELQFLNDRGTILKSSSGLNDGTMAVTGDVARALGQDEDGDGKNEGEQNGVIQVWTGEDPMTGERVLSMTTPLYIEDDHLVGGIRMVTSLAIAEKQTMYFVLFSVAVSLLFFALVVLSNRYFLKSILEPVTKINVIAKEIAAGRYGMRLQKAYDDEIGELCDTINYMSDEISRTERMKNDFISSVSHELRTPLTAIDGWSETLLAVGATDPEEVMQGLEIIHKESRRLTRMVEELLDFARIESGRMKLEVETFDLEMELYEAVYMYENMLANTEMKLSYHTDDVDSYFVNGDRHRMKQVFLNIIDNAVKYGKSGGRIEVDLRHEGKNIVVCVRDYGVGIPEAELPFVKEKFYKGSSKERGSGIGLAVTDEIVKLHGGTLTIRSKAGEGTAVYVSVPAIDVHTALGVETSIAEENTQ